MNVFKTYIKLIPSFLSAILIYGILFTALMLMTVGSQDGISSGATNFGDFSALTAVNDLDNTPESRALTDYLENHPNIEIVEVKPEKIQDSLYYRKIEYALTINKGYAEKLRSGDTENVFSTQVLNNSTSQMYMETQLNSFVSCASLYITGGYDSEAASVEAAKQLNEGVTVTSYQRENGWHEENRTVFYFFNYMPYILLMMILQIIVPTITAFFSDDLRSRALCSPVKPVFYTAQIIAGAFTICLIIVAALTAVGAIISGGRIFEYIFGYSYLQLLIFAVFSLALSALIGVICSGSKKVVNYATSMVSNVLGLGMAFLCGVFVPQSLMGEEILNFGKFFPAYWYVKANNMVMGADNAVFDNNDVIMCILIQALFAGAVLAATLVVSGIMKGKRSK